MKRPPFSLALALGTAAVLAACSLRPPPTPELATYYNRAAMAESLDRNPVIIIPGILGSRLYHDATQTLVWGGYKGDFANPEKPQGARLLALPMRRGTPLDRLGDDVRTDGALDSLRVGLLGVPITLTAYRNILVSLGVGGYRDQQLGEAGAIDYGTDHYTCFQFPYDWRRDNVENAKRLAAFIEDRRRFVAEENRKRFGVVDDDVKFDLVAHSMGGLIARYYLRYGDADLPDDGSLPELDWAGAEHVERAILVATPSAGSVLAVRQLLDGVKFAPILPRYEPAVLGTFPSIYQLMPRVRHGPLVDEAGVPVGDFYDAELWADRGWGLANPEQDETLAVLLPDAADAAERRAIALDHLDKSLRQAERFHAALDAPAAPPRGTELHLIAGDAEPTAAMLVFDGEGKPDDVTLAGGDGTVTRSSALMDERLDGAWTPRLRTPVAWSSVRFIFASHLGLTKDAAFTDNLLYLLLEDPRGPASSMSDAR